jgi:hypothetical protein
MKKKSWQRQDHPKKQNKIAALKAENKTEQLIYL